MRAKSINENQNFERGLDPKESMGIGMPNLFAIAAITEDFSNIELIFGRAESYSKFEEEKKKGDYSSIALFKINGAGDLYIGADFDGSGDVELLESYPEY